MKKCRSLLTVPVRIAIPGRMPTYLWSGKSPSGEERAARVEAADVETAKAALLAKGWSNLELHKTEIGEYIEKSSPNPIPKLSPQEDLKFHKGENAGLFGQWWSNLVEAKGTLLLIGACLAMAIYRRNTASILTFGGILVGLILLFPVLHIWFGQTKNLFVKLHTARTWWRWQEVLQYIDQLKRAHTRTNVGISKANLARYWALALVGTGHLEQGVKIFNDEAEKEKMPEWLKLSFIAEMYNVAQQFDKSLELRRQSVSLCNGETTAVIDLAIYLVEHFTFVDEAKALLAEVETKTVPVIGKPFVLSLKGLIAWREGDYQTAERFFRESLQLKQANAKNKYYIYEGGILLAKGRLAMVNAALGNKQVAQQLFAEAEPYLKVTRCDELIAEYHKHMSATPSLQSA
jgi:tetratricopeptide (TPR) repeat protein